MSDLPHAHVNVCQRFLKKKKEKKGKERTEIQKQIYVTVGKKARIVFCCVLFFYEIENR